MRVSVRYFAAARESAGRSRQSVEVPDGSTVGDLGRELSRLHPDLGKMLRQVRFSVNQEVVGNAQVLGEGDEVGVLPPVVGG